MNKFMRWCDWETRNDFLACGYFCVMLFCYGLTEFLYGKMEVRIFVLLQMFVLNYALSVLQRIVLNEEKEYSNREYNKRAAILTVASICGVVLCCHYFSWFTGRSVWAEIFMYVCMASSYLFVFLIVRWRKKYDTKELNRQLEQYKQLS